MFLSAVTDVGDFVMDVGGYAAQKVGDLTGMDPTSDEALATMGYERRADGSLNHVKFEDSREFWNDIIGYDDRFVARDRTQFADSIVGIYNDPNMSTAEKVIAAGSAIGSNLDLIPGLTTESIGFLYALGMGGFLKLGSVAKSSKAAKAFEAFGMTGAKVQAKMGVQAGKAVAPQAAKAQAAITKLMGKGKGVTQTAKAKGVAMGEARYTKITQDAVDKVLKERVAVSAAGAPLVLAETNKNMEEFRKENNGVGANPMQIARIATISAVSVKLDHLIDKALIGGSFGKKLNKTMKDAMKTASFTQAKSLIGKIGKGAVMGLGHATAGSAVEGVTETLQETMNIFAQRFGAEKWENKDIFDKETMKQLAEAGILGAMGGLGMSGAGGVKVAVSEGTGVKQDSLLGAAGSLIKATAGMAGKGYGIVANELKYNKAVKKAEAKHQKEYEKVVPGLLKGMERTTGYEPKQAVEAIRESLKEFGNRTDNGKRDIIKEYVSATFGSMMDKAKGNVQTIPAEHKANWNAMIKEISKDKELGKYYNTKGAAQDMIDETADSIINDLGSKDLIGDTSESKIEKIKHVMQSLKTILGSMPFDTDDDKTEIEDKLSRAEELLMEYAANGYKNIKNVASEFDEVGFLNINTGKTTKKSLRAHDIDIVKEIRTEQSPSSINSFVGFAKSRISKLFNDNYTEYGFHQQSFLSQLAKENKQMTNLVVSLEAEASKISDPKIKKQYEDKLTETKEMIGVADAYIVEMKKQSQGDVAISRNDKFGTSRKSFKKTSTPTGTNAPKPSDTDADSNPEPVVEPTKPKETKSKEPKLKNGQERVDGYRYGLLSMAKEQLEKIKAGSKSAFVKVGNARMGLNFSNDMKMLESVSKQSSFEANVHQANIDSNGKYSNIQSMKFMIELGNIATDGSFTKMQIKVPFEYGGVKETATLMLMAGNVYILNKHATEGNLQYQSIGNISQIFGSKKAVGKDEYRQELRDAIRADKKVVDFFTTKDKANKQNDIESIARTKMKDAPAVTFGLDAEEVVEPTKPVEEEVKSKPVVVDDGPVITDDDIEVQGNDHEIISQDMDGNDIVIDEETSNAPVVEVNNNDITHERNGFKYTIREIADGAFKVYKPDGSLLGEFDTERKAKINATKDSKTYTGQIIENVSAEEVIQFEEIFEPDVEDNGPTLEESPEIEVTPEEEYFELYKSPLDFQSEMQIIASNHIVKLAKQAFKKLSKKFNEEGMEIYAKVNAKSNYAEAIAMTKNIMTSAMNDSITFEDISTLDDLDFIAGLMPSDVKTKIHKGIAGARKALNNKDITKALHTLDTYVYSELKGVALQAERLTPNTETVSKSRMKIIEQLEAKKEEILNATEKLRTAKTLAHNEKIGGTQSNNMFMGLNDEQKKVFSPKLVDKARRTIYDGMRMPIMMGKSISDIIGLMPKSKQSLFNKGRDGKSGQEALSQSMAFLKEYIMDMGLYKIVQNGQVVGDIGQDGKLYNNSQFEIDEFGMVIPKSKKLFNPLALIGTIRKGDVANKAGKFKTVLQFDVNVMESISLSALQMFSDMNDLSRTIDNEMVMDLFGFDFNTDEAEIERAIKLVKSGEIPSSVFINQIGKQIYSSLGLKQNRNVDSTIEEQMIASLGRMAYGVLVDSGLLLSKTETRVFEVAKDEQKSFTMAVMNKYSKQDKETHKKLRTALNDFSHLTPAGDRKNISTEPDLLVPQTIRNTNQDSTTEQQESTKHRQEVPYKMHSLMSKLAVLPEAAFQVISGYVALENKQINDAEAQESINMQIENDTADVYRHFNQIGDRNFYIPWDHTKSDREMMDGYINPQGSKIMRFLMGAKDMTVNIVNSELTNENKNIQLFKLALTQAFDLDLDKVADESALSELEKMITIDLSNKTNPIIIHDEHLQGAVDFMLNPDATNRAQIRNLVILANGDGADYSGGEKMHAIQGAESIAKLITALKDGTDFENNLMIEADAVTSGMALTLLQIGSAKSMELLAKTGIYTDEMLHVLKNMMLVDQDKAKEIWSADDFDLKVIKEKLSKLEGYQENPTNEITHGIINETDWFFDFYTTIGVDAINNANKNMKALSKKLLDDGKGLGTLKQRVAGVFYSIMDNKFTDKAGVIINNKVRKIAKSPVMVYIYGSSIKSIMKKLGYTMGKDQIVTMLKNKSLVNLNYNSFMRVVENEYVGFDEMMSEPGKDPVVKFISLKRKGKGKRVDFLTTEELIGHTADLYQSAYEASPEESRAMAELGIMLLSLKYKNKKGPDGNNMVDVSKPPTFQKVVNGQIETIEYTQEDQKVLGNLIISDSMVKQLQASTDIVYGDAFEEAFNKEFKEVNKYRDTIKSIEYQIFSLFDNKYKEALAKHADKNGDLTKEQAEKAFDEVINGGFGHNMFSIHGGNQDLSKTEDGESDKKLSINHSNITSRSPAAQKFINTLFESQNAGTKTESGSQEFNINKKINIRNERAAPTISIHSLDSKILRNATTELDILHIYDAAGMSTDAEKYQSTTDQYNEDTIGVSREWSVIGKMTEKMNSMYEALTEKEWTVLKNKEIEFTTKALNGFIEAYENAEIDNDDFTKAINELSSKDILDSISSVQKERQEFLSQSLNMNHMHASDIAGLFISGEGKVSEEVKVNQDRNLMVEAEKVIEKLLSEAKLDKFGMHEQTQVEKEVEAEVEAEVETKTEITIADLMADTKKFGDFFVDIMQKSKIKISTNKRNNMALAEGIVSGTAPASGMWDNDNGTQHITLPDFDAFLNNKSAIKRAMKATGKTEKEIIFKAEMRRDSYGTGFTVVHEHVHAKTTEFMDKNPKDPRTKYIIDVYTATMEYMDKHPDHELNSEGLTYWKTSPDEFIAEAMSKPHMIKFLSTHDFGLNPTSDVKNSILQKLIAKMVQMLPNVEGKTMLMEHLVSTVMDMNIDTKPEPTKPDTDKKPKFTPLSYAEKANKNYDKANEIFEKLEAKLIVMNEGPLGEEMLNFAKYNYLEQAFEKGLWDKEVEQSMMKLTGSRNNDLYTSMKKEVASIKEYKKEGDYNTKKDEDSKKKDDTLNSLEDQNAANDVHEFADEVNIKKDLQGFLMNAMVDDGLIEEKDGQLVPTDEGNMPFINLYQGVQNVIQGVMDSSGLDILSTFNEYATQGRTRGSVNIGTGVISLHINRDGDSMFTKSEVMLHEVIHLLTEQGLLLDLKSKKILREMQEEAAEKLDYTAFFEDASAEQTTEDIAVAKKLYDYVLHGSESEFMAYGLTNQPFNEKLAELDFVINKKSTNFKSKTANKLYDVFLVILDVIKWSIPGTKVSKLEMETITSGSKRKSSYILKEVAKGLMEIQAKHILDEITDLENETGYKAQIKKIYKKVDTKLKPLNKKTNKLIGKLASFTDIKLRTNKFIDKITEIQGLRQLKNTRFIQDVYNELTLSTTDARVAGFYDLFRHIKKVQEADKEDFRNNIEIVLNKQLTDVTEPQRKAIKRTLLDTDANSLINNGYSLETIAEFMRNPEKLRSEIVKVNNSLGKGKTANAYRHQAQGLGHYMVNNVSHVVNQMKNASNIYKGFFASAGKYKPEGNEVETIAKIDVLASLYALEYSGDENKSLAVDAISNNEDGILTTMTVFENYMKNYNKLLFDNQDVKSEVDMRAKGYSLDNQVENLSYIMVKEEDVKDYERQGMTVVKEMTGLSFTGNNETKYMMVGGNTDADYYKGAMDIIGFRYSGTTVSDILRTDNVVGNQAASVIKDMVNDSESHVYTDGELNFDAMQLKLIPAINLAGSIMDYRTEMSHQEKVEYLAQDDDIIGTISNTLTNTMAKHSAHTSNQKVVDYLINDASQNYEKNPEDFIVIEPETLENKSDTADQWKMIPAYTRDYIYEQTGSKNIVVRKALINDIMGYKSPTLANAPFINRNVKLRRAVAMLEKFWKSVVTKFKGIIVTMTSSVSIANMVSNMMFAMQHGINPIDFAKKTIEAWKLLDQHELDMAQINEMLILEQGGIKIDQAKLKGLRDKAESNGMHKFILNGMFTPIVEDINAADLRKGSPVDKVIDKISSKVPSKVKPIIDILYLNENTMIYKKMLKLIQYGDITARYAVYENLKDSEMYASLSPSERSSKLKTKAEKIELAKMRYLDEMLVNYSYNENKYLKYLNDVGLVMFTKYFFRTPKAIVKMLQHNSTIPALFQGAQQITGIDVVDPMDTYYRPFEALANRLGSFTDMAIEVIDPNIHNLWFDSSAFYK